MTLNKESDKTLYRLSFYLLRPNYIAALSFIKVHDRNCPVHSFHPIFLCSSLCVAGLSYDYINTLIYFVVASDPPQIWDVDPVGFFLSFLFVVLFVCLVDWIALQWKVTKIHKIFHSLWITIVVFIFCIVV